MIKRAANDAADAASLYYSMESFSAGIKVFDKEEGNKVIKKVIVDTLVLDNAFVPDMPYLQDAVNYKTYYFDGTGEMTIYNMDTLISNSNVEYPYEFKEELTGYVTKIKEPGVIVTIDAGEFKYQLSFIKNRKVIRTSGYEYVGYGW